MPEDNNISFLISPERARKIQTQLGLRSEGILTALQNGTLDVRATTRKQKPQKSTIKPSYQGEIKDANKERLNRSLSNYAANNFLLSTSNIRPDQYGNYSPELGQFAGNQGILTMSMGFEPFNASNYYKAATLFPKFRNWGLTRTLASELNNEVRVAGELGRNVGSVPKTQFVFPQFKNVTRTVQDNGKIRLSLPSHTDTNPRQFVLEPQGNNKFYVHMRTWDGDHIPANLSNEDKQTLFQALYDELPEGGEILFPKSGPGYYGTRGTVAGLQRLSRDSRFSPGTKGTLQYIDKDGTIKTYEGTSFIKKITQEPKTSLRFFEQPSYERVNYSKYSVDATNPQEREIVFKHWISRYPNSGLKLLDNPQKISIGWDGENYLKVGEMPLSDRGKAIADVMKNRMLKYPFREGIDPQWIVTPGRTSNKGISGFMDQLKNENTIMYMPLVQSDNIEGLSFASQPYLKINPWRNKPYHFSQIHEGLSHPTDPVVSELRTSSGNKILGNVFKDSQGATHVEGSYGKVTWPEDLYDKELLEKLISKDSRKSTEGRAVNWEMITDLYAQLAKKKGISFEEATKLPEIEFNNFVESTLDSPEKLTSFMKKFDNRYLSDYADVLKIGDSKQQAAYGNRILRMIKKAPSYILPIIGGDVVYQSTK